MPFPPFRIARILAKSVLEKGCSKVMNIYVDNKPREILYLPDGRIVIYSEDSVDKNIFELWLAERVTR